MKSKIEVKDHILVPAHTLLSYKDKSALLELYKISLRELPRIMKNDPAIAHLNAKEGDVVKIIRKSATAGEAVFYRGVVNV